MVAVTFSPLAPVYVPFLDGSMQPPFQTRVVCMGSRLMLVDDVMRSWFHRLAKSLQGRIFALSGESGVRGVCASRVVALRGPPTLHIRQPQSFRTAALPGAVTVGSYPRDHSHTQHTGDSRDGRLSILLLPNLQCVLFFSGCLPVCVTRLGAMQCTTRPLTTHGKSLGGD
jgi:hypothetical protein